jgi:glycosyltransferase involved in cell wall biosynthesis
MNIWYLCKYVAKPGNGYVGMRPFYLMNELSTMGCNIDLITSSASAFRTEDDQKGAEVISSTFSFHQILGLQYRKAQSLSRIVSWFDFEIRFFLSKKKSLRPPDVIMVSSPSVLSILNGFIWSKWYKAKLVFEVRDIWPLTLVEEGGFSKKNPLIFILSILERWSYDVSDLIVGTMPNLCLHVSNVAPGNQGKVTCLPFGYPDRNPSKYFRSDYPTDSKNSNLVIGYVGTIGTTNALETLFEAIAYVNLVTPKVEFHIVGDGPLLGLYEEKYRDCDNIIFKGLLSKENVFEAMRTFDILYLSTKKSEVWHYGQSLNKLVDYMLAGKPIIASYSGFPSMIDEAGCGWFVEAEDSKALADKILDLSAVDRGELISTGVKGREWILKHRKYSSLARDFKTHLLSIMS